jgi:hypothetical protein
MTPFIESLESRRLFAANVLNLADSTYEGTLVLRILNNPAAQPVTADFLVDVTRQTSRRIRGVISVDNFGSATFSGIVGDRRITLTSQNLFNATADFRGFLKQNGDLLTGSVVIRSDIQTTRGTFRLERQDDSLSFAGSGNGFGLSGIGASGSSSVNSSLFNSNGFASGLPSGGLTGSGFDLSAAPSSGLNISNRSATSGIDISNPSRTSDFSLISRARSPFVGSSSTFTSGFNSSLSFNNGNVGVFVF